MTKSLNLPVNNVDSKAPETEGIEGLERRVNACCQRSRKLLIQVLAMLALIAICIARIAAAPRERRRPRKTRPARTPMRHLLWSSGEVGRDERNASARRLSFHHPNERNSGTARRIFA